MIKDGRTSISGLVVSVGAPVLMAIRVILIRSAAVV